MTRPASNPAPWARCGVAGVLAVGILGACRAAEPVPAQHGDPAAAAFEDPEETLLELVETAPVQSSLGSADLREAWEVWIEMVDGARRSIDLGFFYVSDREPSRLTQVIEALERAGERGVAIRVLLSAGFRATVPETVARLEAIDGSELRWLDLAEHGGGVLHAKYFIVDREELFVGSQNFDWRALEHIQELGLRVRSQHHAAIVGAVFDHDWRMAGDGGAWWNSVPARPLPTFAGGATAAPRFSPHHLLPFDNPVRWDLPELLRLIDGAEQSVRVQLLSYRVAGYDGEYWDELDAALRRAAARGVDVRLIVSDWDKRPGRIEAHQSLQPLPNVEVRMLTVPPAAEGHIPFARVVHAKYLVVDGSAGWLGTSNWSRDYFHASRNVGFVLEGGPIPARLDRFHADNWESEYAYPVDACADYEPPRIGE